MNEFSVVEICAGAGGQALGLEKAGFEHALAVELDGYAAESLRLNRDWKVAVGDVASGDVWNPNDFHGVSLLAGGVPCPPFSVAGKQLGANDERDLFAWAVELAGRMQPKAVILENVRGLSSRRFAAYRQHILDRFDELGYSAQWRLLYSSDYGVVQLRPRFVLTALRHEDAPYFRWPEPSPTTETVGSALREMMGAKGWQHLEAWVEMANGIAPTLVGGSKKHGGADLGPTRAKAAWRLLGVDGRGVANDGEVPERRARSPKSVPPKLTIEMVARIQGWEPGEWRFAGGKTARYRQIGNAFPPPVAEAVGAAVMSALRHEVSAASEASSLLETHDPIYKYLRQADDFVSATELLALPGIALNMEGLTRRVTDLVKDFEVEVVDGPNGLMFKLGKFHGFVGQSEHRRNDYMSTHRSKVS